MTTTIEGAFREFKSNLEPTGLQKTTISSRQQSVRDAVSKELSVSDSFLAGSYSRSTMIAPLKEADVDIFIILDNEYFYHYDGKNGGQAGLLDLLKRALKRTYTKTPDISRNGQAVTITFTDFIVDVVPAFDIKGGGYLIPNSISQNWISTDPKKHVEMWTAENQAHNGNLVPLIKMIKRWNKMINNYFMSFHLEVMVLQILYQVKITDFSSGTGVTRLGPIVITAEGLDLALSISLKCNAIILANLALLSTSTIFSLAHALAHFRVPTKMVQLIFFSWRYFHVIDSEFHRMKQAIKVRGFEPGSNLHTYRTYAYLIGTLFIKSLERGERVYKAMLCRGFDGTFWLLSHFRLQRRDICLAGFTSAYLFLIIGVEWINPCR